MVLYSFLGRVRLGWPNLRTAVNPSWYRGVPSQQMTVHVPLSLLSLVFSDLVTT